MVHYHLICALKPHKIKMNEIQSIEFEAIKDKIGA